MRGVSALVIADVFLLLTILFMALGGATQVEIPSSIQTVELKKDDCFKTITLKEAMTSQLKDDETKVCVLLNKVFLSNFKNLKFVPTSESK